MRLLFGSVSFKYNGNKRTFRGFNIILFRCKMFFLIRVFLNKGKVEVLYKGKIEDVFGNKKVVSNRKRLLSKEKKRKTENENFKV